MYVTVTGLGLRPTFILKKCMISLFKMNVLLTDQSTDRPTNQPTNRQSLFKRCEDAPKKSRANDMIEEQARFLVFYWSHIGC